MQKRIEIIDFFKSFGKKKVHEGVSLEVYQGEVLGLVGGSGTGKSVLLRSMIGLEKPDQGKVMIDGTDIVPMNEKQLVDIRKKVAYAFQGGALFDSMTVYENLAYPLREHTRMHEQEISDRIHSTLDEFGLGGNDHIYPAELSGGMQKRVGMARAIIMGPQVILYDEPTAGLDPYNTKRIQDMILKLKSKGATGILVTHDMPTAFEVCDRFAFLFNGKIDALGTAEDLQKLSGSAFQKFVEGERP